MSDSGDMTMISPSTHSAGLSVRKAQATNSSNDTGPGGGAGSSSATVPGGCVLMSIPHRVAASTVDSAALLLDVVDQDVLAQSVRLGIEGPAAVQLGHLLDELLQSLAGVEHEGRDDDAVAGAAQHLAQCRPV